MPEADSASWRAVLGAFGSHYPITRRQWWRRFALFAVLTVLPLFGVMKTLELTAGTDVPVRAIYQGKGQQLLIHTGSDATCTSDGASWQVPNAEAGTTISHAGEVRCDEPVTVFHGAGRIAYTIVWSWWTWALLSLLFVAGMFWWDRRHLPAAAFAARR